jgi:DNA-binding transcriptional MerR regulator
MEKIYAGDGVPPWIVQKVLIESSPAHVTSITEACKLLAKEYRVTAETLRCYASLGVPPKSKTKRLILEKYREIDAKDKQIVSTVRSAQRQLLTSIDSMVAAFEKSKNLLVELREEIAKESK